MNKKCLDAKQRDLEAFDKVSGRNQMICTGLSRYVRWLYDGPHRGFIS
jgi:hypothetical protein